MMTNKEKASICLHVIKIEEDSSPDFYAEIKYRISFLEAFYTIFSLLNFSAAALVLYNLIKVTSGPLLIGLSFFVIIWGIASIGIVKLIRLGVELFIGKKIIAESESKE